jgi:uncharacterized repeat protein (TIGR01451 family)
MDNRDGTLSIFGTVLDAAASSQVPPQGSALAFDEAMLASIGREFAYNDPQAGLGSGEGTAADQNVELLVEDPRTANLELVKSDSPDPVDAGDTLTYTLGVANHGPSDASGVTVTDMLPPSVTFGSATPSQGTCMHAAGTVTCDLGDLADGASASATIEVTPNVAGTITNQASVDSNQDDSNLGDNSDTEETTVQTGAGGYPRPKGATPLYASLVPSYQPCTAPNRTHGPPLVSSSCAPPEQESSSVTVGTPDANGRAANSVGSLRLRVVSGDPGTTSVDEADVEVALRITDVRRSSDLADYTGDIEANSTLRITDRWNSVGPGPGNDAATVIDVPFPMIATCAATADPSIGGLCDVTTSWDALVPDMVKEGKRAIWELDQLYVTDGGSDGSVNTLPNTVFARQGVFVP